MGHTEKQKMVEIEKLLAYIYFQWNKPVTDELVSYWRLALKGLNIALCWRAAQRLVLAKTYGEPKIHDFVEAYLKEEAAYLRKHPRPYNPWITPTESDGQPRRVGELICVNRKLLPQ